MKTGVQKWVPVFFYPNNSSGNFQVLDDQIMRRVEANPGFKHKEKWLSPDGKQIRVIYYFDDSGSLRAFSRDEVHLEAKARYAEWYDGYRVEIADNTANGARVG